MIDKFEISKKLILKRPENMEKWKFMKIVNVIVKNLEKLNVDVKGKAIEI